MTLSRAAIRYGNMRTHRCRCDRSVSGCMCPLRGAAAIVRVRPCCRQLAGVAVLQRKQRVPTQCCKRRPPCSAWVPNAACRHAVCARSTTHAPCQAQRGVHVVVTLSQVFPGVAVPNSEDRPTARSSCQIYEHPCSTTMPLAHALPTTRPVVACGIKRGNASHLSAGAYQRCPTCMNRMAATEGAYNK